MLRLVSILASGAYESISIVCGGGGIPPRLAHARTAETRPFLLLFGPGNEAKLPHAIVTGDKQRGILGFGQAL